MSRARCPAEIATQDAPRVSLEAWLSPPLELTSAPPPAHMPLVTTGTRGTESSRAFGNAASSTGQRANRALSGAHKVGHVSHNGDRHQGQEGLRVSTLCIGGADEQMGGHHVALAGRPVYAYLEHGERRASRACGALGQSVSKNVCAGGGDYQGHTNP